MCRLTDAVLPTEKSGRSSLCCVAQREGFSLIKKVAFLNERRERRFGEVDLLCHDLNLRPAVKKEPQARLAPGVLPQLRFLTGGMGNDESGQA